MVIVVTAALGVKAAALPAETAPQVASAHQAVAGARLDLQVARLGGIGLDLLPEPAHELLQELPVAVAAMAPDMRQQSLRARDVTGVRDQDLQQPNALPDPARARRPPSRRRLRSRHGGAAP